MQRRALLTSLAASSIGMAGCVGPLLGDSCGAGADFSMDPATDTRVANAVSSSLAGRSLITQRVVNEAITSGETTYRGHYKPDLYTEYVVRDGDPTYFRIEIHEESSTNLTGYRYVFAFGSDVSTPSNRDRVIDFDALSKSDRESIQGAVGGESNFGKANSAEFSVTFVELDEATREPSAFVPRSDVEYVSWQGKEMRVTFKEECSVSVGTYTVTAERIAESTAAFANHVLDNEGLVLNGLTADQRTIVEQAIDDEYDACEPYSNAFDKLLERLSIGDGEFVSFVRYDGSWYFVQVFQWIT